MNSRYFSGFYGKKRRCYLWQTGPIWLIINCINPDLKYEMPLQAPGAQAVVASWMAEGVAFIGI